MDRAISKLWGVQGVCCSTPFAPLKGVQFMETLEEAIFLGKIGKVVSSAGNLIKIGEMVT